MAGKKAGSENISAKLHEAIEGLRKDVTRVEIWATALSSFSQPVPEYKPDPKFELGQSVNTGSLAENPDQKAPGNEPRKPPG